MRKVRWHYRENREAVVGRAVTGRGEGVRRGRNRAIYNGPTE